MTDDRWQHAADLADRLLRAHGPLTADALIDLLIDEGFDADLAESAVHDSDNGDITALADGRLLHTADLISQLHFTHRVTADEITADIVEDGVDLEILLGGTLQAPTTLLSPSSAIVAARDADALADRIAVGLVLPRGTLAPFQPGDLVEVSVTPAADPLRIADDPDVRLVEEKHARVITDHRPADVVVTAVPDPVDDDLTDSLAAALGDADAEMLYPVLWTLAAVYGHLRRPGYPLSELIERAGFEVESDWIARRGFDFTAFHDNNRAGELVRSGEVETEAHARAAAAIERLVRADADDRTARITSLLADNPTLFDALDDLGAAFAIADLIGKAALLRAEWADMGIAGLGTAHDLLVNYEATCLLIARHAPRRAKAGATYLAAIAAMARGDLDTADTLARDALRLDPSFLAAHQFPFVFALLRNDLDGARSALEVFPEELRGFHLARLAALGGVDGPEPGRNDPCWCGSGRKFKVCHRGKPRLTAHQRNELLLFTCVQFCALTPFKFAEQSLEDLRLSFAPPSAHAALLEDPFVKDTVLIEGGLLRAMLDAAGSMMPADDRLLAEEWLTHGRSLFEVVDVEPGESMELRDVRTDEHTVVTEHSGSMSVEPGDFVCTRVVPEGDGYVLYGGIEPVGAEDCDELIELLDGAPTPEELITLLSQRFQAPQVFTRAGEPMVRTTSTFALAEPDGIKRKLSRRYGKPIEGLWLWVDETGIRGTLSLSVGDDGAPQLIASGFDEPTVAELHEAVSAMDPGAVMVDRVSAQVSAGLG